MTQTRNVHHSGNLTPHEFTMLRCAESRIRRQINEATAQGDGAQLARLKVNLAKVQTRFKKAGANAF